MTKTFTLTPNLTCPELAGYKLPPISRSQEDDLHETANESRINFGWTESDKEPYIYGFISGYAKAREKCEFTTEHIERAIIFGARQQHMFGHINRVEEDNFIQSLRTPRHPIAIEVEMWPAIPGKSDNEIPKTNPDGTVKGIYIYE